MSEASTQGCLHKRLTARLSRLALPSNLDHIASHQLGLPTKMKFFSGLLLCAALLCFVRSQDQVSCYYGPEPGDVGPTMKPCPRVNASHPGPCCRNDDVTNVDACLSNRLCWSAKSLFLYEGQCTDQAFAAGNCLSNCRDTGAKMGSGMSLKCFRSRTSIADEDILRRLLPRIALPRWYFLLLVRRRAWGRRLLRFWQRAQLLSDCTW